MIVQELKELKEALLLANDYDDVKVTLRLPDGREMTGEVTKVYTDKDEVEIVVEAVEKED